MHTHSCAVNWLNTFKLIATGPEKNSKNGIMRLSHLSWNWKTSNLIWGLLCRFWLIFHLLSHSAGQYRYRVLSGLRRDTHRNHGGHTKFKKQKEKKPNDGNYDIHTIPKWYSTSNSNFKYKINNFFNGMHFTGEFI